jgi:tetratricopeptide (TPR) repeat protein
VLAELEQLDDAIAYQERALAIFEKHPEDGRHEMNTVLFDLGVAYMNAQRMKEAVAMMQRALESAEREYGPESGEVGLILGGLLATTDGIGDHERAREYGQRALAITEKKYGAEHQAVARVLGDLAGNANARHQPNEALQLVNRALSIIDKPANQDLGVRYVMLAIRAEAELALNRVDAALVDARAARDGFLASDQLSGAAEFRLVIADALWRKGHKREALAEVKAAQDVWKDDPKLYEPLLAKARDWLAAHKQ